MKKQRQLQKEQTRKKLLEAAISVFARQGFLATSTLDIAKEAGVSHGTFFLHFPTREHQIADVIEEFGIKLSASFSQILSAKKGVKEFLMAHLKVLKEYEPLYTKLVQEGHLLPTLVRQRIFLIQSGIAKYLEEVVKQEIAKGNMRQLPLSFLLNSWLGLIHYYLMNGDFFVTKGTVLEKKSTELIKIFMQLIRI